jgi:imidazolonepropionase-like amidohydrolase
VFVKRIARFFVLCLIPVLLQGQEHSSATKPLVLLHATVIDATGESPQMDKTVVVEGARIVRIGSARDIPPPGNAQVVDAHGLYLIPGLWDMHVHIWATALK